jgi:hypothetical protein
MKVLKNQGLAPTRETLGCERERLAEKREVLAASREALAASREALAASRECLVGSSLVSAVSSGWSGTRNICGIEARHQRPNPCGFG